MAATGNLLATGSVIGGYRIDGLISRGGMGLVYRATNLALDRIYALKVLAPELAADPKFQERFKREMRIAASLHHPNVVGIHYAGEQDAMTFFVMDLISGTDLRQVLIDEGPLEPNRAVELLRQVASALDAAHAVGLVHRDVKPGNILIAPKGGAEHAYLTDFGLAKRPDTASGLTGTGLVVGTVDYIAPEQISGDRVDARSDTYALGCVFYQMLTGKVPYRRANSFATMLAHLNDPPPALEGDIAERNPEFAAIIKKAMCKDPNGRYFSAGDFARDASAVLLGGRYSGPPTIVGTGEANPLVAGGMAAAAGEATALAAMRAPIPPAEAPTAPTPPGDAPTAPTPPGEAPTVPVGATAGEPTPPTAAVPPAGAQVTEASGPGGPATEPTTPARPGEPVPRAPVVVAEKARRQPWYERAPFVAALTAALAVGIVVALFAGHVIGGSSSGSQSVGTATRVATRVNGRGTTTTVTTTTTTTGGASSGNSGQPVAPPPPPPPPAPGALAAVNNYWNDIRTGNFAGAYALLAPGTIPQSESEFVSQHMAENITSVQVQGMVASSSGTSATVDVVRLQTVDSMSGCKNWTGDYVLSDASGSWLITHPNITSNAC
jgi:serine/threonine-protein kinase